MSEQEQLSSAALCRANGWGAGTVLECPGQYNGPGYQGGVRFLITAVGERAVLGREIAYKGLGGPWSVHVPGRGEEEWSPGGRDWRKVEGPAQGAEAKAPSGADLERAAFPAAESLIAEMEEFAETENQRAAAAMWRRILEEKRAQLFPRDPEPIAAGGRP